MDSRSGVVVFRRTGSAEDIDAIDQYSRRLVDELSGSGVPARYEPRGLSPALAAVRAPDWVLLQYNPFRYGRWGFAPWLVRDVWRLRRRGIPLAIMVHEAWVDGHDWRTTAMGLWQRAQACTLVALAQGVMTSTEALALSIGRGAIHVPVASNVPPVAISSAAARNRLGLGPGLTIALFGRAHESRALDYAEAAIAAIAEAWEPRTLVVLNLGADAPQPSVPPDVRLISPGRQPEHELSLGLSASDLVLLPLVDGVSTRRGTLMAALAHGRPVVGLAGENTDSILIQAQDGIVLTPAGDSGAYARAAVALAGDLERRQAIGANGRRLYDAQFDWPVLLRRVVAVLASIGARAGTPALAAAA